jgi:hypothetical protein
MRVERFGPEYTELWDAFVQKSKNGTFLVSRGYIAYHADRFADFSLLVFDGSDELIAVLPAHRVEAAVLSHAGLSYGGFITDKTMKVPKMLQVFEAVVRFLQDHAVAQMLYKTVPHIYHRVPAEEDLYALFLCDARLVRRGILTVVDDRHRLPFQERRLRGAKKARQSGLAVRQTDDFATYWAILAERLLVGFGTQPVHSLEEIEALRARFPENIKLFCVYEGEGMLGGVVVYESERVAHVQYIATNDRSRRLGALDLLFSELISDHYRAGSYFDFGTSDDQNGRALNTGLIDQKEGYGARAVAHDHYCLDITDKARQSLMDAIR